MKRVGIAAVLVVLASLFVSATPVHATGCYNNGTWNTIGYNAGDTSTLGDNFATDITIYEDGCGHKQERWSVWSTNGASLSSVILAGRVWTCGLSDGTFAIYGNSSGAVYWWGWHNQNGCGPQADNAFAGSFSTYGCGQVGCYDAGHMYPYDLYESIPGDGHNGGWPT